MDTVALRRATAADQARIWQLIVGNNLNPIDLRWQNFLVAEDGDGQFIGCGQIRDHDDIHELASLAVVDAWQGRGVSRLLMDALVAEAGAPLWLMCESPLVDYYRRFGFAEITDPMALPGYFRGVYWLARFPMGAVFLLRGTYLAFMVLEDSHP